MAKKTVSMYDAIKDKYGVDIRKSYDYDSKLDEYYDKRKSYLDTYNTRVDSETADTDTEWYKQSLQDRSDLYSRRLELLAYMKANEDYFDNKTSRNVFGDLNDDNEDFEQVSKNYGTMYDEARQAALDQLTQEQGNKNVFQRVGNLFTGTGSKDSKGFTAEQRTRYNDLLSQLDAVNESAGYVTTTDQSQEVDTKRRAIIDALNMLDAEAGREARSYDERNRASNIFQSWGNRFTGSYENAAGVLNDVALAANSDPTSKAILDSGYAGWATDDLSASNIAQSKNGTGIEQITSERDKLYKNADTKMQKSQEQLAQAKYGVSDAGSFLIDAAQTGMDMGADAIVNAATLGTAGLASMGVRVFGQTAQESRIAGDDLGTSVAKGLVSSAIEVFTEKIGGGFEGIYGKSITNQLFSKASTPVIRAVADFMDIAGVKFIKETAEEGFEEWLSDALNMIADHALGWSEEGVSFLEDWNAEKEQRIYDTVLGAFMGAFGGSVNLATSQMTADTDIANQALSNAALMNNNGDAYFNKIYNKYNSKVENGKQLTNADVEKLSTRTEQAMTAYDSAQINSAVQERLTSLGETSDVAKLADAVTKQAMGESLSSAESKLIAGSKYGTRVSNELNTFKIAKGETGAEWVKSIGTKRAGGRFYGSEMSQAKPSTLKVSNNKKTTDASGKEINIAKIASIGKDGMTLTTADGQTIKASDVRFASNSEAYAYEAISKMGLRNAENANEVLQIYRDSGLDADVFARAAMMAVKYGETGQHDSLMQSKDGLTGLLNKSTREALYNIGASIGKEKVSSAQASVNSKVQKAKVGNGKIIIEAKSDPAGYTAKQRTGIQTAEAMSGMTGRDVHIFESYRKNGDLYYTDASGKEVKAPNGFIDENGDIWLDLKSGKDGEGIILNTYAHELTHFIKMFAPEKFQVFAEYLFNEISKQTGSKFNFENTLRSYMNRGMTADLAIEEMVADACDTMLQNGKAQSVFAELQMNKDLEKEMGKDFWSKLKEFVSKLLGQLKQTIDAYKGVGSQTSMGRLVQGMESSYETIQKMWAEALSEAANVSRMTERSKSENATTELYSMMERAEPSFDFGVDQEAINSYIAESYEGKNESDYKKYSQVSERLINDISNEVDDISEYSHALRGNDIRHIRNSHGENTNEKYPVTEADIQLIPYIVENYDKVIVKEDRGRKGVLYVKATPSGITYYVEAITIAYGQEKLLINKQMIKTGADTIPTASGMKNAILQKQTETEFLSDLNKVRQAYAQSVYQSLLEETLPQEAENVNINYDAETESANPTVVAKSERTWTESDYVQVREQAAEDLAKALDISKDKALAYIDSVNSIAKAIASDRNRLDFIASEGVSALVGNTEYGGSIDFSTICKKRRLLTGTFSAIQKALPNTALTAQEILEIRKMMDDKGYEVSCGLCYVEGSRAKMGEYAKDFLDTYAKTDPEYLPNMAEINTPEGIDKIRLEHPEVYAAYEKYMNALAQRKPKLYQLATEYKGEILNKFKNNKEQVEKYNHNGGLRLQSFSDFELIHLLDNMQVIMDMARVGLAGQAYTKVPEFAWAMGATGLKINLSLISKGVDANGRIILDEKEGMKRADAEALRKTFSDNVGTILVVFNDEQLKAAMADDFIDFIIPFHRSQWNKAQYKLMGLPEGAKDYTPWQNESYIDATLNDENGKPITNDKGKKKRPNNFMPNNYWDFSKTGKENAEQYLLLCAMGNRTPKFSNLLVNNGDGSYSLQSDGSTDGYWKLLIDFKMYNNEGKGVPQKPVKPVFNEGSASDPHSALGMLAAYEGGHEQFPVAQDIVDSFVDKYKSDNPGKKYSQRDNEYSKAVESGDMDTAQQMVNEAAREAGFTVKAYHGSPTKGITVFDRMRAGSNTEAYSDKAIWFSNDEEFARSFSKTTRPSSRSSMIDEVVGDNGTVYGSFLKLGKSMDFRNLTAEDRDLLFSMNTFYKDRAAFDEDLNLLLKAGNHQLPKIFINYDTLIENGYNSVIARIYTDMNVEEGRQRIDRSNPSRETVEYGILNPGQIKSADPVTYDNNGNAIPLSERFSDSSDIRYSARDNNYMDAVESGDMKSAQKLVNEAATDAGFTTGLYHGTDANFTVFDKSRKANGKTFGNFIYLTDNRDSAKSFATNTGKVMELAAKLGNTLELTLNSDKTTNEIRKVLGLRANAKITYSNIKSYISYMLWNDKYMLRDHSNDTPAYDSVKISNSWDADGNRFTEYLVNNENQVKSMDPVTYDDNGNVIPLSERFSESKDIRYSQRNADKAAKHFGTTENYHEAGYILADGRMLDFSGRHWGSTNPEGRRDVDHEDIYEVLQRSGDNRLYFINEGNIRFSPEAPGINLSAKIEPTAEQYDRIREFLKQENAKNFYVDFEGRKADKLQYTGNVNADKVIADMKKYYRTGETSEQSVVSQFHFADDYYEPKVNYSRRVTDPETLAFLNKQLDDGDYVVTYKSLLEIDGKLYPPMASMTRDENGKYKMANAMEYGKWEESVGNPNNIIIGDNGKGYYNLKKDNGKTVRAAYNPYQHSSNLVLNDQFEEAYQRPNLVTVKCYIPKSELTSGYRAEYAKDAVGLHDWKAGTVASKLKSLKRQVYLSRWLMPVERVSDADVAAMYKEYLSGENVAVPFNVVPPNLLTELEKAGVNIDYEGSPIYRRTHTSEAPMKFSERYDGFSNRELLAEALEDTALTKTERNYIKDYQRMIGTVDVAEMQIEKINRDLQTETNPDRITFLKNELKVYADRIDRYDQKLFKLIATEPMKKYLDRKVQQAIAKEHGDAVAARNRMHERYRADRAALVQRMTEEKRTAVAEVRQTERERADQRVLKQKQHDLEVRQRADDKRNENAGRNKYKKQVQEKVQRLTDWLLKNSDKEHIPENLKAPLLEFITAINFDSKSKLSGGKETKADEKFAARLLRLQQMLQSQQDALDGDENAIGFDTYIDLPGEAVDFLKDMSTKVTDALNRGEEFTVNTMTAAELKNLSNFLSAITTSIRQMNNLLANERYSSIREAADQDITDMQKLGRVKDSEGKRLVRFLKWEDAVPFFAMKRFGKGGASIFESITKGWEKFAFNAKQIIDFADKTYTKKEVNEWKNDIRTVELEDGSEIRISIAQIMALKCLLKREQAVQHIEKGGVRIGNIQVNGKTITDTTHYHLSSDDIVNLLGMLSERQSTVADRLQNYMATQGAAWGNEVSMRRFGYEFYTEGETYFPIATDANDRPMRDTDAQTNSMFRLLNLSSSKSLNPRASNALVVNDIFDVFADHMADQAKLNGLGLPILDAIKWFSYREKIDGEDGTYTTRTLQGAMEQAFGSAAQRYFKTLMKDINGVKESGDRGTGVMGSLMSNYKIAAVAANLRVALLQPTAYVRASFKVNPKYLLAAFAHKNGYQEAMKYSGTAVWKSLGYYDTDISRGLRQQIEHNDTVRDVIADKSMTLAELGDQLTWGRLWVACKLQTKAQNSSLTGEALNQATADLFREVIYSSQVMDSTLTRSEVMRGNTIGTKMMTSFMAEPTLSYNILLDAYSTYENDVRQYGKAEAWKRNSGGIGKAFTVYVASAAFSAVVESLADAIRDDDDEEFIDKFLQALLGEKNPFEGNLVQDLSLIGKIPVLKDLMSLIQGYEGSNMTTASFTSVIKAVKIWIETIQLANGTLEKATSTTYYGNMTAWGKVYKSLQALSQLTGIAVSNALRDATAIWNTIFNDRPDMKIRTYDDGSTEKWTTMKDIFPNKSEYDAYVDYIGSIHTTDDKTRKEQVVEYINSMKLTSAQKDRLYLASGYKDTTLDKTPWH